MENNLTIIDVSIIKITYVYNNHVAVHLKHCKCFVYAFVSTHKKYILRKRGTEKDESLPVPLRRCLTPSGSSCLFPLLKANFEKGTINTVSPLPHNDIALTKLVLRSTRKFSVLILHASWQQSRLTLLIRASLKLPGFSPSSLMLLSDLSSDPPPCP